jgi:hypothetical protein
VRYRCGRVVSWSGCSRTRNPALLTLEKAGKCADSQNASKSAVAFKRQIGIQFALFASAILGRDKCGDSEFLPATQRRIDNVLKVLEETGFSKGAAIISITAFLAPPPPMDLSGCAHIA